MNTQKAVCECKNLAENKLIVAIQKERFSFIEQWGLGIWIMVFILTLVTGGIWLLAILAYHFNDIVHPIFYCSQCKREISVSQFRV